MAKSKLTLEQIRQKMEAEQGQEAQRIAEMETMRANIANLEKQIEEAVDQGNIKDIERLEEQQIREKTHLATMERVNARKLVPERYKAELREICADKCAELQPIADKALAELLKAQKTLLEKKINYVRILNDAANFRIECGSLAGVGALYEKTQLDEFDSVTFDNTVTEINRFEHNQVLQMDPEYYINLANARNHL